MVIPEKRSAPRLKALKLAEIETDIDCCTIDCLVTETSSQGARLKLEGGTAWVPAAFHLLLAGQPHRKRAEVIWRKEYEIGIRFIDEAAEQARAGT